MKGLLPLDGAGCSTAVDCVPELVLTELPPSALGLQLPLAQPATTSCLREQNGGKNTVSTASLTMLFPLFCFLRTA
jgi:hypothetical protein